MRNLTKDYKANRTFYTSHLPGITPVVQNEDIELYTYTTRGGAPAFICFRGKQSTPAAHSAYFTVEQRDLAVRQATEAVYEYKRRMVERRAERRQQHTLKVGDILSASWGYEQTNVDFYQVTKVIGKNTVEIREIRATYTEGGHFTQEYVMPVKDAFLEPRNEWDKTGLPMVKRVNMPGNGITISSFEYATPWDGKPECRTALGYGH